MQFHPAYAYQDFIGGIVPDVRKDEIRYALRPGVFKRFCDAAARHPDHPFVLIIDEINRANVSGVFGELLYALEYRGEPIDIPSFGSFLVPANVFVIGTMNTLDKNLDGFDLALRRRFLFMKHRPDMSTLSDWNAARSAIDPESGIDPADVDDLAVRADGLNQMLTDPAGLGLPEDYGIGQAYLMKILDFCAAETDGPRRVTDFSREQLWIYHLEPLIEEYLGAEAPVRKAEVEKLRLAFVTEKARA